MVGTALPPVIVVLDPDDDVVHVRAALAAHDPAASCITLHPAPGTTGETYLGHDLLAAIGKPPRFPGRFTSGSEPSWQAATAWILAADITRLTVLRTHLLTGRRLQRLLELRERAGLHLVLVCHRPRLSAVLHQCLPSVEHTVTGDLALSSYYGGPAAPDHDGAQPVPVSGPPADRWVTLAALDRLVSADSVSPCPGACTPPLIDWRYRPPPPPLTRATTAQVVRRIHARTAHPGLATALATAIFTGTSLQQLATARPQDFEDRAATVALHDPARYTDGCATHPIPPGAQPFLRAASHFAALTETTHLLAKPQDRTALLRLAEAAKLRPPQPPATQRIGPPGRVEWAWHERHEARRYDGLLAAYRERHPAQDTSRPRTGDR